MINMNKIPNKKGQVINSEIIILSLLTLIILIGLFSYFQDFTTDTLEEGFQELEINELAESLQIRSYESEKGIVTLQIPDGIKNDLTQKKDLFLNFKCEDYLTTFEFRFTDKNYFFNNKELNSLIVKGLDKYYIDDCKLQSIRVDNKRVLAENSISFVDIGKDDRRGVTAYVRYDNSSNLIRIKSYSKKPVFIQNWNNIKVICQNEDKDSVVLRVTSNNFQDTVIRFNNLDTILYEGYTKPYFPKSSQYLSSTNNEEWDTIYFDARISESIYSSLIEDKMLQCDIFRESN